MPLKLLLAGFLAVSPCWSQGKLDVSKERASKVETVKPDPALSALLAKNGYRISKDGSIVKAGLTVTRDMLASGGIGYGEGGKLYFLENGDIPPTDEQLLDILKGLFEFKAAGDLDPRAVGRTLQAWGIPPVFDGTHLLNPDGTATYYGRMLYQGIHDKPDAIKMMSGERLSASLKLFGDAYSQAFHYASADAASGKLQDAWGLLQDAPASGERALDLRPYSDQGGALKDYAKKLAKAKESDEAVQALKALEKYKYHADLEIPSPKTDGEKERPAAPKHGVLPFLLSALDKVNGKPLTPEQQEWLIKSFPMGEVVWRAHAQDLWKQGFTGAGVKVAVIDDGTGFNPDLDEAVVSRQTFTHQRGKGTVGEHGTHVAGTIHALAPDAEIRSYQALEDSKTANPDLTQKGADQTDGSIMRAVDAAVKDGNQIINMSLGGSGSPSGPLARKIEEYAKQGVIFVIAAGNEAGKDSVESPSSAPSAITVGALDVNDRITSFTSYGSNFDPRAMREAVKTIFMAPGDNIVSTLPAGVSPDLYGPMSGTSMATPDMSGTIAMLVQGYKSFSLAADPAAMSRRIQDALARSGKPIPRNELPSDVPPKQKFIIVDPRGAMDDLRPKT